MGGIWLTELAFHLLFPATLPLSMTGGFPVKLIYAAVFALFPLAAPAQILDSSTIAAVCNESLR